MKVILVQDIPNLGVLGDQVQVKPGYARNFLIPQGKAILASSKTSKELEHRMLFFQKLRQAAIEDANSEAAKLVALQLEITKKAGLGGRLFGSVTNKDIAALLEKHGFEIPRRNIVLYESIKTVGTHKVNVKLHTEVKMDINIKVLGDLPQQGTTTPAAPAEDTATASTELPATEEVTDSTPSGAIEEATPEISESAS